MSKEEFLLKEVKIKSEEYDFLRVERVRTSSGTCLIKIHVFNKTIELSNEDEDIGDNYEDVASELARIIEEVR